MDIRPGRPYTDRRTSASSFAEADTFAIVNVTVEPVARPRIERGTVLVRDGKIAALGRNVAVPAKAEKTDAKGRTLTPGLIDARTRPSAVWIDGQPVDLAAKSVRADE